MTIPKKLYHCAPQCTGDSINEKGLVSNYGEVYAGGSIAEALTFMWFRLLDHPHHELVDGKLKFEIVPHDEVHIWEIDTTATGKNNWDAGTDHSPSFFGKARSYTHRGDISRDALRDCHIITREEIESLLEGAKNA
jgi:hypothetical protein